MKNTGGAIAIVGGIFGILAAMVTGFFGGIRQGVWNWFLSAGGASYAVQNQQSAAEIAQYGMMFSTACVVLGFITFFVKSPWLGAAIIITSVIGIGQSSSSVGVALMLAGVGGALAISASLKKETAHKLDTMLPRIGKKNRAWRPPPEDE